MSQDNEQEQSRVIGEMFDASNIAQPAISQETQRVFTSSNIQQPVLLTTDDNGFTVDDVQAPEPQQPAQESSDD